MTVVRLTQGVIDRLLSGPAPARDVHLWSDREAGFGVKRAAGSKRVAYCCQWRDPQSGRSHRITLGDAAKLTITDARSAMQARAGEIARGLNPLVERKRFRASLTFREFVERRYLTSEAWTMATIRAKTSHRRHRALA